MTYVGIGKSWKNKDLIQLLSIIKQLKDFKCNFIRLARTFLELSFKSLDFLKNSVILKLISLQNLDILPFKGY